MSHAPPPIRSRLVVAGAACLGVLLSACSAHSPSTLKADGPGTRTIAGLWWFMFAVSAAVILLVTVLILVGIRPRLKARSELETPPWSKALMVGGGVIFPVVVLSVLWVLTLHDMSALSVPATSPALTVNVIGHQWWWEVRYPTQGVVTANDVHIPVGQPVRLNLTTADVNHSFWVPQLTAKTDMIAGRLNTMWLQADKPGVYRGQCAEYCGLQHANMIFYVVADARVAFARWMSQERQPPVQPSDPTLQQGQQAFVTSACTACHTIQGTTANGRVGPDLTHFGSRVSIGAGAVPNTAGNLGGWIIDSQSIKPGNIMPPIQVAARQLQALIQYLESLK